METLEQFLKRAKKTGFVHEAIVRIIMWKFHKTRAEAERLAQ
jgi:hypothetical protein